MCIASGFVGSRAEHGQSLVLSWPSPDLLASVIVGERDLALSTRLGDGSMQALVLILRYMGPVG